MSISVLAPLDVPRQCTSLEPFGDIENVAYTKIDNVTAFILVFALKFLKAFLQSNFYMRLKIHQNAKTPN